MERYGWRLARVRISGRTWPLPRSNAERWCARGTVCGSRTRVEVHGNRFPAHDDGVLCWVRLDAVGKEEPTDAPIIPGRPPSPRLAAVTRLEGVCEPCDVVANRLDPWHGAWFHPYSFTRLEVLSSPAADEDLPDELDRFVVAVTFRMGRLGVPVIAEFTTPDPRTVVVQIIDGEGQGSVVETHVTPPGIGPDGVPRTAVVEAVIGYSDRRHFGKALFVGPAIRPLIGIAAKRLGRDGPRPRRASVRAEVLITPPDAGAIEQRDLLDSPGADSPRNLHGSTQLIPRHPCGVHDLGRVGGHGADRAGAENRADLVLRDTVGIDRVVAKFGQHTVQFHDVDPQLLACPARDRVIHRLVGRRVPAERVGPYAGECPFVQGPPGQQHPARVVEEVAGECQMQRRGAVVYLRLGCRTNAAALIVEKDNQLLGLDGVHGHHRNIARTDRTASHSMPLIDSSPPTGWIGLFADHGRGRRSR